MRKILCLSTLFVLLALMVQVAFANDWDIYVRGRIITDAKASENHFYVPVKSFLDAMKYSYNQDDRGVIHLSREAGYKRSINLAGSTVAFELDQKEFNIPIKHFDDKPYVDLEMISSKMGLSMTKTPETGIIDVVDKVAQAQHQKAIAEMEAYQKRMQASQANADTQTGAINYDPNEPVKQVGDVEGFLDQTQWEARWKVTIKNYADQPVNNVRIVLHIQDGNGQDLDKQIKVIGTMNPGDQTSADYYWQSTSHILAFPKVEIQHDPLPKPENKKLIETKTLKTSNQQPNEQPQQ